VGPEADVTASRYEPTKASMRGRKALLLLRRLSKLQPTYTNKLRKATLSGIEAIAQALELVVATSIEKNNTTSIIKQATA
jgi:hypothetical protein